MKKILSIAASLLVGYFNSYAQKNYAAIKLSIPSLKDGDVATLSISPFGDPLFQFDKSYECILKNHSCYFKIPVRTYPVHFNIRFRETDFNSGISNKLNGLALDDYFLENGDRLNATETHGHYTFKGKGSNKMQVIERLKNIALKYEQGYSREDPNVFGVLLRKTDSSFLVQSRILASSASLISRDVFTLLKADLLGRLYARTNLFRGMPQSKLSIALDVLKHYKSAIPSKLLFVTDFNKKDILKLSSGYTYYGMAEKYRFDSCLSSNKPFVLQNYFSYIKHRYTAGLRERMLINLVVSYSDSSESVRPVINGSYRYIKTREFKELLEKLRSHRLPGAPAFNFSLPDTSGKKFELATFRGKVIVLDFWFTGCGSCIAVKPYLEKAEAQFMGKPVVFLTINNDDQKESWIKSVRTGIYTSNNSINLFADGRGFNNPIAKFYNIYSAPDFIVIGKDGRVTTNPENPRFDNGKQLVELLNSELKK